MARYNFSYRDRSERYLEPEAMDQEALLSQMSDTPALSRETGDAGPVDVGVEGGAFTPSERLAGGPVAGEITGPSQVDIPTLQQTQAPSTAGQISQRGGIWGSDYEWKPSEGGPRVADISMGDTSRLGGFDTSQWGTGARGSESLKNTFGRIASNVDPGQENALSALMSLENFKKFFPNARQVGNDKIDFGDERPVDVLVGAQASGGGKNWAWQTSGGPSAGGASSAAMGRSPGGLGNIAGLSGVARSHQQAYDLLSSMVSPNAPREEMEAAIEAAFGHLPGYEQAYKESVKINGRWHDLIRGYGGGTNPNAAWQGLGPGDDPGLEAASKSGASTPRVSSGNNSLIQQLLAEVAAAQNGEQSPMDQEALLQMLNQQGRG